MRKVSMIFFAIVALIAAPITAMAERADTMRVFALEEVSVVSSPKSDGRLRQQPASVSMLTKGDIQRTYPLSLKGASTLVPNLYVPDYGSRLTSAIYIRGIGSRIGTPAVGMYVDNVPLHDKSSFDFSFADVERIDVLRGPQSTLYGRNTMGGLIKVHTKSPLNYQGTDVQLGYGTGGNERRIGVAHYHRPSDRFAFSAAMFYNAGSGVFTNTNPNAGSHKADHFRSGGAKMRAIALPSQPWMIDMSASIELSREGAYPYYYAGAVEGAEQYPDCIDRITNNIDGLYRRTLVNAGVNVERKGNELIFNSVTGFQHINDHMLMDQDFVAADIYTLEQRQRISTLSEELTLKNGDNGCWQWLAGVSTFYQWTTTTAPVTFRSDGVDWLNATINTNANRFLPSIAAGPGMTLHFNMDDHIVGQQLLFDDHFRTPTWSAAVFHQSTLNNLFGLEGMSAILGLRLDYERQWLDYNGWYDFQHAYSLAGNLVMPTMQRAIEMVPVATYDVHNALAGKLNSDYLQFLPRIALRYTFDASNVYATISRGYRSGGYNVQNISELLRSMMTADMMRDVQNATIPVLEKQPMVPADTKQSVKSTLTKMADGGVVDVDAVCHYKPEYAWNYEVGTHLNLLEGCLAVDASAFVSDVRNLQLSQMSETGLGRITVNAGRSRSMGAELAAKALIASRLALTTSYGYTHATLRNYTTYDATTSAVIDCRGKRVPFIPDHTISFDAAYTFPLAQRSDAPSLTLAATYLGTGRIFWDEPNSFSQPFHSTFDARASLALFGDHLHIDLAARNIFNTSYNVFAFTSMSRRYEQRCRPRQFTLGVRWHF